MSVDYEFTNLPGKSGQKNNIISKPFLSWLIIFPEFPEYDSPAFDFFAACKPWSPETQGKMFLKFAGRFDRIYRKGSCPPQLLQHPAESAEKRSGHCLPVKGHLK
ncbi:MAG: hypothetical protein K2N94_02165 [Lachnospiraceae bacterium]|nr:hypothetical protein [Lachnospiraceae bacterium]